MHLVDTVITTEEKEHQEYVQCAENIDSYLAVTLFHIAIKQPTITQMVLLLENSVGII